MLMAAVVALTGLGAAAIVFRTHVLVGAWPVGLALFLLLAIDSAYPLGQRYLHRRRRDASQEERAEWLPSAATRKPLDFPGVMVVTPQMRRAIGNPAHQQERLRARGVRLAVLPLLAIVMLSIQTIFLSEGGPLAVGFAAAECALLLFMLLVVWAGRGPTLSWVSSRLRAELFRRENYMLLAQIGPYLNVGEGDLERVRDARINLLLHADISELRRLTNMSDNGTRWIDKVWQCGPSPADAEIADRMQTYLEYRILRQILFFKLGAEKHERTEKNVGLTAKCTVLAGVTMAIIYAGALAAGGDLYHRPLSMGTAALALLAAGLPALCNSAIAIQNLFTSRQLATSYHETYDELLRCEITLREVISAASQPDATTRFRALAVHVETALSQELLRWRMLVERPEFEPGM